MQSTEIMKFVMENLIYIVGSLVVSVAIMYVIVVSLFMNVSHLKKRYKEMMTGDETGASFENMLLEHIKKTDKALEENEQLRIKNKQIDELLQTAVTRVGVVRFRAFEDMGSDLSYAVALLDSDNNGVVLSSIFGRDDSRSYVKPIENGKCTKYTLTNEEEEAIRQAVQKTVNI